MTVGQCPRKSHDHLDHVVFGDESGQLLEILVGVGITRQGNEWGRQDRRGIAQRDPDSNRPHVDGEAPTGPGIVHSGPVRSYVTHRFAATAARRASIACSTPSGLLPPPCAMSGLPPPRPPTSSANAGTSLPAARPASRASAVVATTKLTLPSPEGANNATTPGRDPSRLRTSPVSLHNAPASTSWSSRSATTETPAISRAHSASVDAEFNTSRSRSCSISFSALRSRVNTSWLRDGTSSAGTLSVLANCDTKSCSLRTCRRASVPTSASTR